MPEIKYAYDADGKRKTDTFTTDDGERSAEIVGTVKYEYSKLYDHELPPKPRADAPRPWED